MIIPALALLSILGAMIGLAIIMFGLYENND
jgi:hypothetical protein